MSTIEFTTSFRDPAIPRVTIKDDEALEAIDFAAVEKYVAATGWTKIGDSQAGEMSLTYYRQGDFRYEVVIVRHADGSRASAGSKRMAIDTIAELEGRSELLVYWDLLAMTNGSDFRAGSVMSGKSLDEIRRIFVVNLDGLEGCRDCEDGKVCADCADCADEDGAGFDCREIDMTNDLLNYMGGKVNLPENLS